MSLHPGFLYHSLNQPGRSGIVLLKRHECRRIDREWISWEHSEVVCHGRLMNKRDADVSSEEETG